MKKKTFRSMVLADAWFRRAMGAALLFVLFLGLFLPRIWPATPPGFEPRLRTSGLSWLKGWSLRRSALAAEGNPNPERRLLCWQRAVAHRQGDAKLIREALAAATRDNPDQLYRSETVQLSLWLLRLTETNRTDLELAARVWHHYGYDEVVMEALSGRTNLNAETRCLQWKAAFGAGRVPSRPEDWRPEHNALAGDPESPLYEAAYRVCYDSGASATEARQRLQQARDQAPTRLLASRLLLGVAYRQNDPVLYADALQRLDAVGRSCTADHARYWQMLAADGRGAEARELARSYNSIPDSVADLEPLARAWASLGLPELGTDLLLRQTREGLLPESLMRTLADLLIQGRQWPELREVALQMRLLAGAGDGVTYSHYLEGLAEFRQSRKDLATEVFGRLETARLEDPTLAYRVGAGLLDLGYPGVARVVLMSAEAALADRSDYWQLVLRAAADLKETGLLLHAAERAHQLKPDDTAVANDYAASLLVARQRPGEAVAITAELQRKFPASSSMRINHILALLGCHRFEEAMALLRTTDPGRLSQRDLVSYHLGLFEGYLGLGEAARARQLAPRIDPKVLFPTQAAWFQEMLKRLELSATSGIRTGPRESGSAL